MNALRRSMTAALTIGAMTVALVGVGAGAAWASPSTPQPPANHAPAAAPAALTGEVVAADDQSLTVRGRDGRTTVFRLTSRTEITKNGRKAGPRDLVWGDRVEVTALAERNDHTATRVVATGR